MNLNDISTQLLYTTMPMWVEYKDNKQGYGTGFIYSHMVEEKSNISIPLLITNYHVLNNMKRLIIDIAEDSDGKPKSQERVRVEIPENFGMYHNTDLDIVAILMAPIFNQMTGSGKKPFFRSITPNLIPSPEVVEKLGAIEEITFIGYPSGIYDYHNITPIMRRGITASPVWNDFQGEPIFLIDAGVFPGSSGSPVFIINQGGYSYDDKFIVGSRIHFLGMLSESIVRKESFDIKTFIGIGVVIKSQIIKKFVEDGIKSMPDIK